MVPLDFLESHPVFTHGEFVSAHTAAGRSEHTSNNLLASYVASGRLLRIRRGLYTTVPRGVKPGEASPDPYLMATKLSTNAVVAYHSTLAFHGKARSVWRRYHYLTGGRLRPFSFRGMEFVPVQAPPPVRSLPDFGGGVLTRRHAGGEVRVTTLERAFVDVLDAPDKGGGWEEILRSLDLVEFLDLDAVIEYTLRLESALTAARVGFVLEQHAEEWMVQEDHLEALRRHAPGQPRYLDGSRTTGTLVSRWNLVVPEHVLEGRWEEAG